jgi:S-adenosylmethionine hydrolase
MLEVNGQPVQEARTFSDVSPGEAFWYANANGLVEFAVNRGRADEVLGLKVGTAFKLQDG